MNVIIDGLKLVYIMLILLMPKKDDDKPVRLQKKEENEPIKLTIGFDYKVLILFSILVILCIFIVIWIYKTGSLESTTYYYRLKNV